MMGYSIRNACFVAFFNVEISASLTFLIPKCNYAVPQFLDKLNLSCYYQTVLNFCFKVLILKKATFPCFVRRVCSQDLRTQGVNACKDMALTFVGTCIRCKRSVLCNFTWHSYESLKRSYSESRRNLYVL